MSNARADARTIVEKEVTWSQFVAAVQADAVSPWCKWRGVKSAGYGLSSSFQWKVVRELADRPGKEQLVQRLQRKLHQYFALAIRGFRGPNPAPLDYNQVWAMGRHFGLNTPFLDWSNSPFLAAYFAVFDLIDDFLRDGIIVPDLGWFGEGPEKPLKPGASEEKWKIPDTKRFAVYQLDLSHDVFRWVSEERKKQECETRDKQLKRTEEYRQQGKEKDAPLETWNPFLCDTAADIREFRPRTGELPEGEYLLFLNVNVEEVRRMQGQRGYFTVLNSKEHLAIEPFLLQYGEEARLTKYVFKAKSELYPAFRHLLIHGIDHQQIYPDLEGAAKQANMLCNADLFHDAKRRQDETEKARGKATVGDSPAT